MIIVHIRQKKYAKFEEEMNREMKRSDIEVDCSSLGVPRQYGLYYAMGLALAMEGVMSACYHVCPTEITFQFDTTFMFLIAILLFIKLFQVRNMPMPNQGAERDLPLPDIFFFNSLFQVRHADVSITAVCRVFLCYTPIVCCCVCCVPGCFVCGGSCLWYCV